MILRTSSKRRTMELSKAERAFAVEKAAAPSSEWALNPVELEERLLRDFILALSYHILGSLQQYFNNGK